ncbi:DUF4248 domain-containing protein [Saccharicrinis aurantiacus]|uniref:DUF4248 domain-containing protein n=1 Tax=Saccharicrinis aurantiacus TaxID=1849719 RepID=UPI00249175B7|nr:DUF4248 domain-containing protein [Saccharicrinis aurantiacus]
MIVRRTILKQDIVKKLYPNSISIKSAMQQLRNEIDISPELKKKIEQIGNSRRHYYTKQQLLLILEHFCITLEEFEKL